MTDAPALLPCPFCGSDKINVERDRCRDGNGVFACIACHNCRAKTRETYYSNGNDCPQTYQNLRDTWNTRARPMTVAEAAKVRETDDEAEVMRRLIEGERIFYSQDGKVAWLSDADRAHVSYRVVWALRNQGYLKRVSSGEGRVFCDEASDSLRALSQGGE